MTFVPNTDELIENDRTYAAQNHDGALASPPQRNLAVVACMDTRLDPLALLGLRVGEAHVIRNAGGVVSDDVIRSLCLSQRALGTREIVLVHHTDCGLQGIDEAAFRAELDREVGATPIWPLQSFADAHADVAHSMKLLADSPFIVHTDHIQGFVFDVETGVLDQVTI